MGLRTFYEIEHILKEMCDNTNKCRHNTARNKVMQEAVESEPVKPNVGDVTRNDLKHGEVKR